MDTLEASSPADATSRRRSGRTVKQPVLYQEDPNISTPTNGAPKRKRAQHVGTENQNEEDGSGNEDSDDGVPGEEEVAEPKKKPRKAPRAAKKAKTAQPESLTLAIRPAVNGARRPSKPKPKPKKPRAKVTMLGGTEGTGLYAEVFLQASSTDDVAANWIESYKVHNANAMCELINFVLRCTGCDLQVDVHDIEDPDNAPNKLTDLQDEYQSKKITEYPLISRAKSNTFSRAIMEDFLESLIQTAHASGILHDDVVFIENIMVWVTAMSSSTIRPFRHTATIILIAIATSMCKIIKDIANQTATTTRQKESEEKRKSVNKGRVAALKEKIEDNETKRQGAQGWMLDIFDTVFVHRYRDVDPRIRADCTAALGAWILTCPEVFFEGSYLRYLGWLLSDEVPMVRLEVLKQLLKLYQDSENLGRLRAFTERFRPRMAEVAAQDAEPNIRALAVELLDEIREMGLLEPDDIDSLGRLVFDSEAKVRKAIAPFFAANVDDSYEAVVEELGGEEGLEDAIGEEAEDDYDSPRKIWLKFKCVAELLDSYDIEESQEGTPAPGVESIIHWGSQETRYTMAAQVVYEGVEEMTDWEMLGGYLLYDISTTPNKRAKKDPLDTFKQRCQLTEKQEKLLLEVLNVAAKLRLTDAISQETDKKGKRSKARMDESRQVQEATASHLAQFLPKLLRKFGANPAAASAVLRLGRILDLEVFQELRQDSTEFDSLLEDINKQFLSHADRNVLAEASSALLHATTFEDLEEVTDSKLQELWDKTTTTLRQNVKAKTPQMRTIANTVHRILRLANISDPKDAFLKEPRATPKSKDPSPRKIIDILLELINQYASVVDDTDADAIITNSANALLSFYMWTVRSIQESLQNNSPLPEIPARAETVSALTNLISQRDKLDEARCSAIGTLLDIHILFATFRHTQTPEADSELSTTISNLVEELSPQAQALILSTFIAAERHYARKTHKSLEEAADDELPDEPESDPEEESDDDENDDESEKLRRRQDVLLAEKRLCELTGKMVLAIVAQVLDASGPKKGELRKRLIRNKMKLGTNFRDVLGYLDEPKAKKSHHKAKPKVAEKKEAVAAPATELVGDEEDEIEEVEDAEEGGGEDLKRRELVDEIPEDDEQEGEGGGDGGTGKEQDEIEDDVMGD